MRGSTRNPGPPGPVFPHPFPLEAGKGSSKDFFCILDVRNSDLRVFENLAGVWFFTYLGLQFCFTCVPRVRLKYVRLDGMLHLPMGVSFKLLPSSLDQEPRPVVGVVVQVQVGEASLRAPAEDSISVRRVRDERPPPIPVTIVSHVIFLLEGATGDDVGNFHLVNPEKVGS